MEGGALVERRLRPDLSPVLVDDPLHGGQTDPRSFKVLGSVQPLEDPEQLSAYFMLNPTPLSRT